MAKAKAKATSGSIELGPDSDPTILYNNYVKECKDIGLEPYGPMKDVLTNEENPNIGKQLIILPSTENVLGPGGCRALVNAMINKSDDLTSATKVPFTATKEIRICRSMLGDGGATAIGSLLSATASKSSNQDPSTTQSQWKLEYIELMDNNICANGALALGKALCVGMNRTLTTLVLDFNRTLCSDGVAALCKGLVTNSTLMKLSLKHCSIDEQGGSPISEMLSFKKLGLVSLDLTSNRLGGLGLSDVCDGLLENTKLKTFRLGDNSVGQSNDDAKALHKFAAAISRHPAIIAVDLLHNPIGTDGGTLLLPAVRDNKQITEFKVCSKMDDDLYKSLFRASTGSKKKGAKGKKKKKSKKK